MPLVGVLGCLELCLYGIRKLVKQHHDPIHNLSYYPVIASSCELLTLSLIYLQGRVRPRKSLLRKPTGRYAVTYTGSTRAVELINKVLSSVKNLQNQGGPWTFTQRIQINVV